jgi:CTP synthase
MQEESASEKSVEEEFFASFPKGYEKGKTKYIIITGSVMSSVGKGTFSGCLATLLSCHGFRVSPLKFDGYLNCDAGTLNPYRHGEVFVLDDGTECDLDLGTYERHINRSLCKDNYLTTGKIFKTIIDKERRGGYLGRDVQFIPHLTGEIKYFLRNLAMESKTDIVLVEVGGTIGDLENSYFIEATRELKHEEGKDNVCFVNITYILEPKSLGEFKSKPAQLGIRKLMELGIQPDIIVCRSERPIDKKVKEKLSIFSDVDVNRIYNLWDYGNIYEIPLLLREAKIDDAIFDILKIYPKENGDQQLNFSNWENFVNKIKAADKEVVIGIVGKYTYVHDSYLSIIKALEHVAPQLGARVKIKWIESSDIEDGKIKVEDALKDVKGVIIPGGFGKRGIEGKIAVIKYARENKIPFLGLCLGMQLAIVEFSRNVCDLEEANSTEFDACTSHPVIDFIPEQASIVKQSNYGGTMRLGSYPASLKEGSIVRKLYNSSKITERHRHRYEVNPEYIEVLEKNGLTFSGKSPDGTLMEFMELKGHPFFVATQAHPEFKSRPIEPSPVFYGFLKASIENIQIL